MDAIVLILAVLAVTIPFAIAKLWWWVYFWLGISVVLAIFELISFLTTKKTMSQAFWKWRKDPEVPAWKKWAIFTGMILFWGYLLFHLFR